MSYYFNLPIITELTTDQQYAVGEQQSLSLSGGPGTGKSVVCLWRHIRNHATNSKRSLLLTYTKTLEHYLQESASSQNFNASLHINRVFWWITYHASEYDEIIIDESQDIKKEEFEKFLNYSNNISFGLDKRQSVYRTEEEFQELSNFLSTNSIFSNNVRITLNRNFRNSKEILLFTRSVFTDLVIPQMAIDRANVTGLKPIMKLNVGWDIDSQTKQIIEIINDFKSDTENIAILVPFAKNVDDYYTKIKGRMSTETTISKYQNEHDDFNGLENIHITTFKSSKGTEFDTVIIPEFDKYNWAMNNSHVVSENDYYVAFTRTKSNLFLLCRNDFPNIGDINTVIIE